MKKVLMVLTNHFTHDARVMKEAVSLTRNGYDVTVRCFYRPDLAKKEILDGVKIERVLETGHRAKRRNIFQKIFFYFQFMYSFSKESKQFQYIHCHDLMPLPIAVFIKWKNLNTQKLIYDCHEYETEVHSSSKIKKTISKFIERFFIRFTDKVIVVSDSIAQEYVRLYKIEKPLLVMNCPPYSKSVEKNYFREKFNIRNDQIVFLYQGALSSARGIDMIMRSFTELPTDKKVIVFMGYGQMQKEITEISNQSDNVFMHEAVSPGVLHDYTSSADVGICYIKNSCLNYYYCMPNKLFEYSMANLPVISSDLFELSKFQETYDNGWIVKEDNRDAFTRIILSIGEKEIQAKKYNIEKVKLKYNWEEQEKNLIALYQSL